MRSHHFSLSASQQLNPIRFPVKGAMQILSTFLVVSLCLFFPSPATAASPHIYDMPQAGPPTSQVQVAGTGFDSNATIDVYFDSTDVGVTVTDSNGAFGIAATPKPTIRESGFLIPIPKDAVPGAHWITAVERITQLQAQVGFTVRTDWPQFHFGADRTGVNPYENVLNPDTVGNLTTHWEYLTVGQLTPSPAVANGVVYVPSGYYDGNLYALDASTGALLWKYPAPTLDNPAPAVANGVVYFASIDSNVYALNAGTGQLLWKYLMETGTYSSVAVTNGVVYVGGGHSVYALQAATGGSFIQAEVDSSLRPWPTA